MKRTDLLTTEEGVKLITANWAEYLNWGNETLELLNSLSKELNAYLTDRIPLSSNFVARVDGLKRVNNTMGIYTNDLHKHIKSLNSGAKPSYPLIYVSQLRAIDKEAQIWKAKYNEAVNAYKVAQRLYFLSLQGKDGTFDIAKWL